MIGHKGGDSLGDNDVVGEYRVARLAGAYVVVVVGLELKRWNCYY